MELFDIRLVGLNWTSAQKLFFNVRGVRGVKDLMSRDVFTAFDAAGIGIASATYDIVVHTPIRIERTSASRGARKENGAT